MLSVQRELWAPSSPWATRVCDASSSSIRLAARAQPDSAAIPVPDLGIIYLDDVDQRQVVTNIKTGERKATPPGRWVLEFDNEGFGLLLPAAAAGDLADPIALDEFMKFSLWQNNDGRIFIALNGKAVSKGSVDLKGFAAKHTYHDCSLKLPLCNLVMQLEVAAFKLPKIGAHFFFSASSLHKELQLSSWKERPWRWAVNGSKVWHKRMQALGYYGHLELSWRSGPLEY